jgi:mRNA interferase YafQ
MMRRGYDVRLFDDVVFKLKHGMFLEQKYCEHRLKGEWNGCLECHIQPNWILIYDVSDTMVYFLRTGTHVDIFGW